jgi:EAL domain-containing protein (putative c-di-GMP-specific phosphodiesterase class I)
MGDKLLIEIAKRLHTHFDANYYYRINADEFALLYLDSLDIHTKIMQIQEYFYANPITIDTITLNITFTYGASQDEHIALRNSALALKQAKDSGKNRYHIFNSSEDTIDTSKRQEFIQASNTLRNALDSDTIIPFFQGIYHNESGKIEKFEVLVRILKEGKTISPYYFLEAAKLAGLLPEITKIVIDKSFKAMQNSHYTFSINITEDDLSRNYLCEYLALKSKEYSIDPKRVILEILEGVSSTGKKNHINQLSILKSEGYALAIDDFGAEYSNFERILDLDIDFLKKDAKYIKDIDTNPKSYEITRAIAYFAKNANIPCIAEFVHNEAVQKIIHNLGIDFSQGFYFSEPNKNIIPK